MAPDVLAVLASAPDGAYAVDLNHRVVFWNAAAERILGYTAREAIGRLCYQVLEGVSESGESTCAPGCPAILLARSGSLAPYHRMLARCKDGRTKRVSVTHVLLPAENSTLTALVHIFHDATNEAVATRWTTRLSEDSPPARGEDVPVRHTPTRRESAPVLSPRELEVLRLLAQGFGTDAIAEKLVLSPITVRNYVNRILDKLDAHTRLEAVVAAALRTLL